MADDWSQSVFKGRITLAGGLLPMVWKWPMTLITPEDTWLLSAIMVGGTAAAIWLEHRYRWGARLSAPVLALLMAMGLSNTRIVPMEAPAYDFVGTWLVPIALPLLLFRADMLRMVRSTGKLFLAFHVSAAGTLIGAVVAFGLLSKHIPEPVPATGIMTGSYIGGMVNFMALSESIEASGSLRSTLIVADNLVMAAMFLMLLGTAGSLGVRRWFKQGPEPAVPPDRAPGHAAMNKPGASGAPGQSGPPVTLLDLALALAVAVGVAGVAMSLQRQLAQALPVDAGDPWFLVVAKMVATNRFVLITGCALLVSTIFSRALSRIHGAEPMGAFLLYLYLFTVGLPADVRSVIVHSPSLFAFCSVIALVNFAVSLVVGRALRVPLEQMLLAVNATLGGPPTAVAMAMSKRWSSLILPALLVGIWGYVIATPLGLLMMSLLDR